MNDTERLNFLIDTECYIKQSGFTDRYVLYTPGGNDLASSEDPREAIDEAMTIFYKFKEQPIE